MSDAEALPERVRRLEEDNQRLRAHVALLEELRSRLAVVSERLGMLNRVSQDLNTLDLDKMAEIAVRYQRLTATQKKTAELAADLNDEARALEIDMARIVGGGSPCGTRPGCCRGVRAFC